MVLYLRRLAVLLIVAALGGRLWAVTGPVADYRFQNTRASSVAGAPDLFDLIDTNSPANTFVTATVDGVPRTVLHFPQFNGLALAPTTSVMQNNQYTVVMLFAFEETSGYRRILDFQNGSSDNGLYALNGNLNFYPVANSTESLIGPDTFVQVVLTRDAAGLMNGYVDGKPAITFADSGLGIIDQNNTLRFFQDNTGGSAPVREASAGVVARIRVYDHALTPGEVAALDRLGDVPPNAFTLLRMVGGLAPADATDMTAYDADHSGALTLMDVLRFLRP